MGRYKIALLLVLFTSFQTTLAQRFPSRVDSLNSKQEIETLINSKFRGDKKIAVKTIQEFTSKYGRNTPCQRIADSLGITQAFYKTDFDKNGYTDILAIGEYYEFTIFVIMNYGQDSIELGSLTIDKFPDCTFPKLINDTIIKYYFMPDPAWRNGKRIISPEYKDLIFKFGDFIEYNARPKIHTIEKIEFRTGICYGACPVFELSINKDKSSVFEAGAYNIEPVSSRKIEGVFNTVLDESSFSEIINLLNYLDFPKLKDNYEANWTDDQACTLKITYDNGKEKTIHDYGLVGSFGLHRLYRLLFELRFNQQWKQ